MPVNKYEAFLKARAGEPDEGGLRAWCDSVCGVAHDRCAGEELGFSLLKRGRSGARPTAEGERVLPAIRGMLNSREQLEQTAAAIRGWTVARCA